MRNCGTPSNTCSSVSSSSLRSASEVDPPKRIAEASTAFSYSSLEWIIVVISCASRFCSIAQVGRRFMFGGQRLDGLAVQQREDADVTLGVLVADVEPELVELVGRGVARVEPYVAALGLAELRAVGLGDERAGDGERLGFAAQSCGGSAPYRW